MKNFQKSKRLLSVAKSLAISRFDKKIPIRVMHFITFRCNRSCKYCGIWNTPKKEMTTNEIKRAMKEFADAGTFQWVITGGEPLLRKDVGEIINYGRDLGLVINLTTNGLLLKQKIEEVKNASYLVVSLDGPRQINDAVRGKECFDRALEGIKAARERDIDVVINSTISKENIFNNFFGLRNIIQIAEDLDTKINFSVMYKDSFNTKSEKDSERINSVFPSQKEITNALEFVKSYKKTHSRFIMFSDPVINQLKTLNRWEFCYAGKLFCDLFPDGTVAPCLFKIEQGLDGLKEGFFEAFKKLPEQKNCVCSSTCYNELNMTFSLNPSTLVENFVKYLIFT